MKRHIVCQPMIVGITLLVCLAGGSPALAGQGAPPDEGVARPVYVSDFVPGTRVELIDDAPALGPEFKAGMSGVVICCQAADCSSSVLVSWNLWRGGQNEEAECGSAVVGRYPAGSATWVDPAKVRLGLPFNKYGFLSQESKGCYYLETEDGVFHLLLSEAFLKQWWVVRPDSRWRVRGLLDTSAPKDDAACPQADGDVYHPILSQGRYDGLTPSKCTYDFSYGDRVVLIGEANPNGAVDLPRGATGTIICCNSQKEAPVLVSWDLWSKGLEGKPETECQERYNGLSPIGSAWWVSVKDLARYIDTDCGVLEETQLCCGPKCPQVPTVGLFVPFEDVYCLPDITMDASLTDGRFRVMGLFTPFEEMMNPQAITPSDPAMRNIGGVIFDSVVIACVKAPCCDPPYTPGDRVRLLVNQPGGAEGLFVGHGGTVLCCDANNPVTPILVSWDDWTGGQEDKYACGWTLDLYPERSSWWMACTEIRRVVLPDLFNRDEYARFLPESIERDKHLKISGMIGNRGGSQSGPFQVSIYLSTDDQITPDDYLLGAIGMDLTARASMPLSWINPVPSEIPAGKYYVGWIIDSLDWVKEADESNNVAVVQTGQLTVTGN